MSAESVSVLFQASESQKFATVDKIVTLSASNLCELVVVGGHGQDGKGIMHCLGPDGGLRWSQSYPGAVTAVGVSGRGTSVGIGGVDNILYYFTSVGEMMWRDDCRADIKAIMTSHDGRFVLVGLSDGNINYYNTELAAARKFAWKHRFDKPVSTMSMNNDGTLMAAGTEEGEIAVFTEKGDLVWTKLLEGRINMFKLAPEGDAAIVACSDNKVRFYSAEIGKNHWTAEGGGSFIDADLTHRGERAVAVSKDNFVYCYEKTGNLLWKYDLGNPGEKVKISDDGKTIVATSIDTTIHCLDAKGQVLWAYKAGGGGVSGLSISQDGNLVVASTDAGVLFFDNLQVIGGLLPKLRHEMTIAKERGVPIFKAEKAYEESVVALNYGDYHTAAEKIREIEAVVVSQKGPVPPPVAPTPEPATIGEGKDEAEALQAHIDAILRGSEELKKNGVDVEPVENLLGDAMVHLEEGNLKEARLFAKDAKEMLEAFGGVLVAAEAKPKGMKEEAMEAVERAARMLADLETTEISLETVKNDLSTARAFVGSNEFQRAVAAANRAVVTMEKALDPYITECLVNVQKLLTIAEKEGIKIDEAKQNLIKTSRLMGAGDYLGALDTVKGIEEWLEVALSEIEREPEGPVPPEEPPKEEKPVSTIPKVPTFDELGIDRPEDVPEEPEEPETPEEPEEKPRPPVPVPRAKPALDLASLTQDTEDPVEIMAEADEALQGGNLTLAIDKYILTMEALESRTRAVVEGTIDKAKGHIEKVKADGFDVSEPEGLLEKAENELSSGDYRTAAVSALEALEKADSAAQAEIINLIEDSRSALQKAMKLGVEIATAEDLIKNAEEAIEKRDYNVAIEMANSTVEEVEKASNDFVNQIVAEGRDFVKKAAEIGADVTEVKGQFEEVGKLLEGKDFASAHERAKVAVETAKALPKKFVQSKIAEARSKVMTVQKIGADAMMAKNYLIKARSSMAGGNYAAAMDSYGKCMEELDKAPKALVNKRIAMAKANIEKVRAMGQNTDEVDNMLSQAETKVAERDFEAALRFVDEGLEKLKKVEDAGTEVTNVLFEVDMAVAMAAEAGKDVSEARKKLDEAFSASAQDPGKAKALALEVKKMLED